MASFTTENVFCNERAESPGRDLEYPIRSRRNAVVAYEVDSTTGALFCGQENENSTEDAMPHTSSSSSSSDEELVVDAEALPRRERRNAIASCLLDHNGDLRFALVS